MAIENNKNLYLQIWNDLSIYTLMWKNVFYLFLKVCVCVRVRKGDTHKHRKLLETYKKTIIAMRYIRGKVQEQRLG